MYLSTNLISFFFYYILNPSSISTPDNLPLATSSGLHHPLPLLLYSPRFIYLCFQKTFRSVLLQIKSKLLYVAFNILLISPPPSPAWSDTTCLGTFHSSNTKLPKDPQTPHSGFFGVFWLSLPLCL